MLLVLRPCQCVWRVLWAHGPLLVHLPVLIVGLELGRQSVEAKLVSLVMPGLGQV